MITPEAQKIIDEQKLEISNLKAKVAELEETIRQAKEAAENSDDQDLFDGIFG